MIKIGFSLQPMANDQYEKAVSLLKKAGFSAVSPVWSADLRLDALAEYVARNNMTIQSLHSPHGGIDLLWSPNDPRSLQTVKNITGCIDACSQYGVPIAVVHGWQGMYYTFPDEPLDFTHFDYLVDYARQKKVSIAFENLEGEEYLEALMNRYENEPHIGYCWDSGHDHCYPHKTDFLKSFGSRLIMTHINDNLGLRDPNGVPTPFDDLHFLPYDGNVDWEKAIGRMKDLPKQSILNFELKKRSASSDPEDLIYDHLSLEEYIEIAGQRAHQITKLYEEIVIKKAYLFDFDGTLVDSMPTYVSAMLRILDENGISYENDIIKVITPLGLIGTADYYIEQLGLKMPKEQLLGIMKDYMMDAYFHSIPAKRNVPEVLKALKAQGASLNVLTASPHITLDACLKRLGLWEMFDNIWSCEDFETTKADPDIYRRAAEKIGACVEDVLFLDDNINADTVAKSAGMQVCGVYDDSSKDMVEQMKAATDFYIYDFQELLHLDTDKKA